MGSNTPTFTLEIELENSDYYSEYYNNYSGVNRNNGGSFISTNSRIKSSDDDDDDGKIFSTPVAKQMDHNDDDDDDDKEGNQKMEVTSVSTVSDDTNGGNSCIIASVASVKISMDDPNTIEVSQKQQQVFLAIFVPHDIVESSLKRVRAKQQKQRKQREQRKQQLKSNRNSNNNNNNNNNNKRASPARVTAASTQERQQQEKEELQQALELSMMSDQILLSDDILPRIHPILNDCSTPIRGIFMPTFVQQQQQQYLHAPSDIILLDVKQPLPSKNIPAQTITPIVDILMDSTNGEGMIDQPEAIVKLLTISQVHVISSSKNQSSGKNSMNHHHFLLPSAGAAYAPKQQQSQKHTYQLNIPTCPVCLHRIDPLRLGLPKPRNHHLCSKFCTSVCNNQIFLSPWPPPSNCVACKVMEQYKNNNRISRSHSNHHHPPPTADTNDNNTNALYCNQCAMQETLWVCLSCGFCGCGRYSNKHAAQHFVESGHSYSLELATYRIWDYTNGEFAHRGDLIQCPHVAHQSRGGETIASSAARDTSSSTALRHVHWSQQQQQQRASHQVELEEKHSPKKAIMIGEEYEALLQSALEDQAQHYEGEISRLRAVLTAEQIDIDALTNEEHESINSLQLEISNLRNDVDRVSQDVLRVQSQEAGLRATSQRLLREQQVAQDLLKKIQENYEREQLEGQLQVDELEQQIADLRANLNMRHQFSQDEELSNAHIFGTTNHDTNNAKKSGSSKLRRFFRK